MPGAAPRTSTPATAPSREMITVQPVGRRVSEKWPTSMPATSVMAPSEEEGEAWEGVADMAADYGTMPRGPYDGRHDS